MNERWTSLDGGASSPPPTKTPHRAVQSSHNHPHRPLTNPHNTTKRPAKPSQARTRVRYRHSGGGARALSTTINVVPKTLKFNSERLRSTSSSIQGR
jgi:hypothetical protein